MSEEYIDMQAVRSPNNFSLQHSHVLNLTPVTLFQGWQSGSNIRHSLSHAQHQFWRCNSQLTLRLYLRTT